MNDEMNQPITKQFLGDFTEQTLLPAISTLINDKLETVGEKLESVSSRVDLLSNQMENTVSKMVTKEYLDDKLSDLKGDLAILMRKEDKKLTALVQLLKHKKVLSDEDVKQILSLEPFPQS